MPPGVLPPVGVPDYHRARPVRFPTFQLSSFLLCISPQGIGNRDLKCKLQEQNKRVTLNCSDGHIVCRLCVPTKVCEPADHFCGNSPTVGRIAAPATKHNGRIAVKFGTYWSRLNFMVRKHAFIKLAKYQCHWYAWGRSLRIDYGFDRFGYAGRHWWSTVPWSLNLFAMLVLVGVRGNH